MNWFHTVIMRTNIQRKYNDFLIDLLLVNQKTDTGDPKWAEKTCGICSIKMLLEYSNPRLKNLKIMSLVRKGLQKDGYLEKVGWKHSALVDLAGDYGVKMSYQKKFLKKADERKKGMAFIEKNIRNKKPVIVSVGYNFNPLRGGHLVIVRGFRKNGDRALGYYIQDPYPLRRGNNYFVTKKEFLKGWRGGMIWIE